MIAPHVNDLASRASAPDPAWLARQLLLLNEDAIVIAHLGHLENPAMDTKAAASDLIAAAMTS